MKPKQEISDYVIEELSHIHQNYCPRTNLTRLTLQYIKLMEYRLNWNEEATKEEILEMSHAVLKYMKCNYINSPRR